MNMLRRSFPFVLLALLVVPLAAFAPLRREPVVPQDPQAAPAPAPKAQVQAVIAAGRRVEVRVRGATFTGVLDQDLPATAAGWVVVMQDARRVALPVVNVDSVKEL